MINKKIYNYLLLFLIILFFFDYILIFKFSLLTLKPKVLSFYLDLSFGLQLLFILSFLAIIVVFIWFLFLFWLVINIDYNFQFKLNKIFFIIIVLLMLILLFILLFILFKYVIFFYNIGHFDNVDTVLKAKKILISSVIDNNYFNVYYIFSEYEKYLFCLRYVFYYKNFELYIEFIRYIALNNTNIFSLEDMLNEIDNLYFEIKHISVESLENKILLFNVIEGTLYIMFVVSFGFFLLN